MWQYFLRKQLLLDKKRMVDLQKEKLNELIDSYDGIKKYHQFFRTDGKLR